MPKSQIENTAILIQNSSDILSDLRDKTRMTTALAVMAENGDRGIVLASFPGTGDHTYVPRVGFHFHLHCTAPGKALLAFQSKDKRKELVSRLNFRKFTDKTIRDAKALESKLRVYLQKGYSVDTGEYAEGVNCVASCVRNQEGEPVAAVWITALSVELPERKLPLLAKQVMQTAQSISRRLSANNPDTSPYVNETLKQAKLFIEEHYTDEAAIHNFVEGLFMSQSWFRARFRATYGTSPMHYRQKLIFNKAKRLLELTMLPIKEISCQLGFDSQNYFSRAFKKQQGLSPVQYRERYRKSG